MGTDEEKDVGSTLRTSNGLSPVLIELLIQPRLQLVQYRDGGADDIFGDLLMFHRSILTSDPGDLTVVVLPSEIQFGSILPIKDVHPPPHPCPSVSSVVLPPI